MTKEQEETTPDEKVDETEETKTEETEDQPNADEETEEEETKESGEEKEPSQDEWKKLAQQEKERADKAQKALAEARYKKSEARRKQADDETVEEPEEEEDKPLTASQLEKILARERAETEKKVLASRTVEIARDLAESDDEAEAIVAIYNNTIFDENLSHEEKVRRSFYIAHGPRLTAKILELRRSLRSKETKKKGSSEDTHRDGPKQGEPKLSAQDKAEYERMGFKWSGKRFEKKLSNGKFLVKNPKSGKVTVEKR